MKKVLSLLTVAALLFGGAASAQQSVSQLTDEAIIVTFYDDNPYDGGELVDSNFSVKLTDSSIGKAIDLEDDASYLMLTVNGQELVFETWGATSTSSTNLKNVNDGETLTLGDVSRAIYSAAAGETELAIFTSDGVVTGFYSMYPGADTNIDVSEADHLLIASSAASMVYEVENPGATKLSHVNVVIDGEAVALSRLNLS